tara:strand:+ start:457 stop:963 length:507 start_codon:yes stop_codon:yes gene_type:complete
MSQPEAWLLGPIEDTSDALMPVAHSLVQARRELLILKEELTTAEFLNSPSGAASISFHIVHINGSLDRLFSYAEGKQLTTAQQHYLAHEDTVANNATIEELFTVAHNRIEHCLEHLTTIPDEQLYEPRPVGRDELPSTVIGLLFHAAEHTTMHVGQIRTTLKIIRGIP